MANSPAGTLYNSDIPLGFHLPQPLNKSLACGVPSPPTHRRGLTDPTTLNQEPLISRSFSFPSPLHPRTPRRSSSPQVTSPKHSFGTQPLKPREMPRVLSHSSRGSPASPNRFLQTQLAKPAPRPPGGRPGHTRTRTRPPPRRPAPPPSPGPLTGGRSRGGGGRGRGLRSRAALSPGGPGPGPAAAAAQRLPQAAAVAAAAPSHSRRHT